MNGFVYLILCLSGLIPVILSVIPDIAIGPVIFIFGLMICEECTTHIASRHHFTIFFGIFFGVCDYIYTAFSPGNSALFGQQVMSRGSALTAMLWVSICVYTTDRNWSKAGLFCIVAAAFAAIGLIHQPAAVENFMTGFQMGGTRGDEPDESRPNTSPFQFMIGYLSIGGVCLLYYALQKYMPKKLSEGEVGYEDDHGYLPPIADEHVDNIFLTWWDPATAHLSKDQSHMTVKNGDPDASSEELEKKEIVSSEEEEDVTV
jgi:hypothetical protein